jgi:uracil-DNA glycosylase
MIEYKTEDIANAPNFLNADEQYLLCIANCIGSKLDKAREPLTTAIFTKFPEANIYKERASTPNKGKPGSLIVKGRVAIILGTMYPGSKEYANDNREFRLKWFREGLIALQKLGPVSIAVRENFPEEFGGDWHKYLFHLNEMDKSIKVSIYPYVMAIPIFNIVRFRQEDEHTPNQFLASPLNNAPVKALIGPNKILKPLSPSESQKGFGLLNLSKFRDTDADDADESTDPVTVLNMPKLKLPPILNRKPILPIKIEADEPIVTLTPTSETLEMVKPLIVDEGVPFLPGTTGTPVAPVVPVAHVVPVVPVGQTAKTYIANPNWVDLSNFAIQGWDEIMADPIIKQTREKVNNFFVTKELPKFGDFVPIYPPQKDIFNAFNLCPFSAVRVVIIGQDSYINAGEAMGLAFSVAKGVKVPPSLRNIYKELTTDIPGFKEPNHGSLISWAQQGVFLINTALTVREGQSGSHLEAWQPFTDQVISLISQKKENLVFILWGNPAKKKQNVIKNIDKHHIITAAHPSPLSATKGFFGCKCFSETNNYLAAKGLKEIDWNIPA